jgi:CheY-like chemotaxis protein
VALCDIDMPHMNGPEVAAAFTKDELKAAVAR